MVTHNPYDGHPPSQGRSPTKTRMVTYHHQDIHAPTLGGSLTIPRTVNHHVKDGQAPSIGKSTTIPVTRHHPHDGHSMKNSKHNKTKTQQDIKCYKTQQNIKHNTTQNTKLNTTQNTKYKTQLEKWTQPEKRFLTLLPINPHPKNWATGTGLGKNKF